MLESGRYMSPESNKRGNLQSDGNRLKKDVPGTNRDFTGPTGLTGATAHRGNRVLFTAGGRRSRASGSFFPVFLQHVLFWSVKTIRMFCSNKSPHPPSPHTHTHISVYQSEDPTITVAASLAGCFLFVSAKAE